MRFVSTSIPCLGAAARLGLALILCGGLGTTGFATIETAAEQLRTGAYAEALASAQAAREQAPEDERAWRLEVDALLATGRYTEALVLCQEALAQHPGSVRLLLLRRDAARLAGHAEQGVVTVRDIMQAIELTAALHGRETVRSPAFQAAIGEASLVAGLEPRLALENFLKPAQTAEDPARDAFLAAGRLALEKRDFALAARTFQSGLEVFPHDADLLSGLAASFRTADRRALLATAEQALTQNPRHVATHVLLAEHFIDAEQRELARSHLDQALATNPDAPEAHALRAVLAHLERDPAAVAQHRAQALGNWPDNPRVDHLIGRKLSERYQFAEGAEAQRRALAADPTFVPARVQLAQDLLRLGREDEGWALAAQAHAEDAYNVEAYNLTTLQDQLASFTVLTSEHFRVRMSATEAPIYGDRVLALLERAHAQLSARYGLTLEQPTTVEIYPNPKDFAVRTFGMPDIGGFLGVCFGPVFTINSPASAHANWESVLWHEFTHVITLTLTRNRMPRWLSEGISVFEEAQADARWSRRLTLDDRERIVSGRMQPISRMSAAFLEAREPGDTQFAYTQSGLVVSYLVQQHGFERLRDVLRSLAQGREANDALEEHYGPIADLDAGFVQYAREQAAQVAPGFDLRRADDPMAHLLAQHGPLLGHRPNLHLELAEVREAMAREDWATARTGLEVLTREGLYLSGSDNLHLLLARACAALGDTAAEREALQTVARHEADLLDPVIRLLDLAHAADDWADVSRWSNAWIAIHPLAPTPWRRLLRAQEETGSLPEAAQAGEVLLQLDPPDYAAIHYRVARALAPTDAAAARRHVLRALEDAPRFRAAYQLLDTLPPAGSGDAAMP